MKEYFLASLLLAVAVTGIGTGTGRAQPPGAASLEGRWSGALGEAPNQLRLVVNIVRAADGIYLGTLTSVDQGNVVIPIESIAQSGDGVRLGIKAVNGSFEGSISADGTKLNGIWSQGVPLQLEFVRVAAPAPPASAPPGEATSALIQADVTAPIAPTPVHGAGKTILAYELHITNTGPAPLQLSKLEVLSGTMPVASYEKAELNALLQQPSKAGQLDKRAIAPRAGAVAFLWIMLDAGKPVPLDLRHRLTAMTGQTLAAAAMTLPTAIPVVLGPPLRGDDWVAGNGPGPGSIHRQALAVVDGKARIAQRFAIDWVRMNAANTTFTGDAKDNKNYRAYGAEALAAADAVVSATKDGIPENVPGLTSRAVPITLETIGGNHVILDLGKGRFAFYAHLQPGSLKVKVGDKVRRGQVLGLVGNSGNSTEPHLHFHVTNGNSPLGAEGLPYVLDAFGVQETPGGPWVVRRNEIPMGNAKVRFGVK